LNSLTYSWKEGRSCRVCFIVQFGFRNAEFGIQMQSRTSKDHKELSKSIRRLNPVQPVMITIQVNEGTCSALHRRVGGIPPFPIPTASSRPAPPAQDRRPRSRPQRPQASDCFSALPVRLSPGWESGWLDMWKAFLAINRVTMTMPIAGSRQTRSNMVPK